MTSDLLHRSAEFIRDQVVVDDSPGQLDHLRFTQALNVHFRRKTRNRVVGVTASAALALSLALLTRASMQPEPLTYRVGSSQGAAAIGSYVSAPPEKSVELHFSEGSDVLLAPSSRGRVAQVTSDGATMVLEDGRARADIVHRRNTNWQILAGPYVVSVTGTSFDVGFSVATQTFDLNMRSGSVRVAGPGIQGVIEVRDQQRVTLSTPSRTDGPNVPSEEKPVAGAATDGGTATSACAPEEAAPTAVVSRSPTSSAALRPTESPRESLAQLGAKGEHRRVLELAERDGLESAVAAAGQTDLLALGNAARVLGRTTLANKAYLALRERYGSTANAASAAFFLGRLAEGSSPSTAMSWYDKYASEARGGIWAAEALGRKLVLFHQLNGRDAAATPAREYLARFPSGPYAGFARKILAP